MRNLGAPAKANLITQVAYTGNQCGAALPDTLSAEGLLVFGGCVIASTFVQPNLEHRLLRVLCRSSEGEVCTQKS
jgi:hypothetical protein